ncbi:cytochrome c oxidase subunit 4 [Melghirimyces profundicolus]|uniref:Cytochrome c oxidase subunit 4 n=1 Tax=Melghirimyces profundicolus TaxID=1242148 RepID=A0A2T6BXC2_9BACL|nr:cytochrome C oxidase subunit IV family protein [Melghirimyces profundicolus]PTX60729.1 cytochrome c oxidase subunit 4 [Melghirimyces profundicolus]
MEAKVQQNQTQIKKQSSESSLKHLISFGWMILLTAVAFAAVALNIVPQNLVIPLILALAVVQVFLQLFTFMHLDFKKHRLTVMFMFTGIGIGVICAVALWILV